MLKYYEPNDDLNFDSIHIVKLSFLYKEARAEVITCIEGNISGSEVFSAFTDLHDMELSASVTNEINKKYCEFVTHYESDFDYQAIKYIHFYVNDTPVYKLDLKDAENALIGIEIIEFQSNKDNK